MFSDPCLISEKIVETNEQCKEENKEAIVEQQRVLRIV